MGAEIGKMNWVPISLTLVLFALSGCIPSPAGEETNQGQLVVNRPDGVLVSQQHAKLVTRWRGPMDHGASVQADQINFRLWEAKLLGTELKLRSNPVDFVWNRGWMGTGDLPELQNPSFLTVNGRYVPNGCYRGTIAGLDSDGTRCLESTKAPQVVQLGGRSERVVVSGHKLIFGNGLGGNAKPCAVDLLKIATDADQPITSRKNAANYKGWDEGHYGEETGPAFRFAVSYLPPRDAYLIDYGQARQPIYHATCAGLRRVGRVLPLADGIIKPNSEENAWPVTVLDMVADPGDDMPALFLTVPDGESGFRMVVLRSGQQPQFIPYYCHDCLPDIGGFYLGSPDRLLFGARLMPKGRTMTLALDLYDLKAKRETTETISAPDPGGWPQR
jgi:hypothetical protein